MEREWDLAIDHAPPSPVVPIEAEASAVGNQAFAALARSLSSAVAERREVSTGRSRGPTLARDPTDTERQKAAAEALQNQVLAPLAGLSAELAKGAQITEVAAAGVSSGLKALKPAVDALDWPLPAQKAKCDQGSSALGSAYVVVLQLEGGRAADIVENNLTGAAGLLDAERSRVIGEAGPGPDGGSQHSRETDAMLRVKEHATRAATDAQNTEMTWDTWVNLHGSLPGELSDAGAETARIKRKLTNAVDAAKAAMKDRAGQAAAAVAHINAARVAFGAAVGMAGGPRTADASTAVDRDGGQVAEAAPATEPVAVTA